MRHIDEIIVHTAATRPDWMAGRSAADKMAEIGRWHRDRGWSGVGYHYGIDRDGTVVPGRPVDEVGAHVRGRNSDTIGIVLFGGFGGNANDAFREHYTAEQEVSLRSLIASLESKYAIRKVSGHNKYAAKACPCFDVPAWMGESEAKPDRPTLRIGSRGRFVMDLQEALRSLGYFLGAVDGAFGRITERAVMSFQAANGLATDGIVGPRTWAALGGDPFPAPLRAEMSTKDLRERGSREIVAADKIGAAQAGVGVAGAAGVVASIRADIKATQEGITDLSAGVGAEGPLADMLPYLWAFLGLVVVGLAIWSFVQAQRAKAARVDRANSGADLSL